MADRKEQYNITGMSCAACSARVEKAAMSVEGVTACSVSLLTGSMTVEGTADSRDIIKAVEAAGYGAGLIDGDEPLTEDFLEDSETPAIRRRLILGAGFLVVLMYFSMGHMLGLPLPAVFEENPFLFGLVQMVLSLIIIIINRKFYVSGVKSMLHGAPNMDSLVALGSFASFAWSVYALVRTYISMTGEGLMATRQWTKQYYFESAAMILVLITVGKLLEAKSKGRATDAIKSLIRLSPVQANIIKDGKEITVPASDVRIGDIFVVRPGESIPVDGIVLEGSSAVNESALTGESISADKAPDSQVSAATVNVSGFIKCRAVRVGKDTTLSQIIKLVSEAAATKAPAAKIADKVSGIFVPVVIIIALITLVAWLAAGEPVSYALARAISVLVISCPCALGLATPVAIMVGNGMGARRGILFKTAEALEETGKADIVVLDKTGTVTKGEPEVKEISPGPGVTAEELLQMALSAEIKSEHPLAKAIVKKAEETGLKAKDTEDFKVISGSGIKCIMDEKNFYAGSPDFINHIISLDDDIKEKTHAFALQGMTPALFASDEKIYGIIALADTVKDDSKKAVKELKNMGIPVVMLSGDNKFSAEAIAAATGIDYVISDVKPSEKAAAVAKLKKQGKVIMIGDGINDAPALTAADIGIAIGAGTDIAIDAADVVLMNSRLTDAYAAIRLSVQTLKNIKENLFWAFFYNALCIPLAAGCYAGLLGWELNPMIAAAAMSLSSFCVVMNALRLNLFDIYSEKRSKKNYEMNLDLSEILEVKNMKKTIIIEGMMCPHCEAHTVKALTAIEGVADATASYTDGKAEVSLTAEVSDAALKAAVEEAGYKVIEIK